MSQDFEKVAHIITENLRDVPDFPKAGIVFKDITPLLSNPEALRIAVKALSAKIKESYPNLDSVVGIEARGFIFGSLIAQELNLPFIPVRKKGKLPWKKISQTYNLEYGTATIELHEDAITEGQNIIILDDLLATGGTAEAAFKLITQMGGNVNAFVFMISLEFLKGRQLLEQHAPVISLAPIHN